MKHQNPAPPPLIGSAPFIGHFYETKPQQSKGVWIFYESTTPNRPRPLEKIFGAARCPVVFGVSLGLILFSPESIIIVIFNFNHPADEEPP